MNFNYADWVEGTYQTNNDPTEFNEKNRICNLCDKEAQNMDEHCDDHQKCIMCGENDDCGCEEEWSQVSHCCEAKFDTDIGICHSCKEHCSSAWDSEVEAQIKLITN